MSCAPGIDPSLDPLPPSLLQGAIQSTIALASRFRGQTSPNPPVGACALDRLGNVLSLKAHEKAGDPHAEARVLSDLRSRGILGQIHTLFITLEPCNHHGRTPPCTLALLETASVAPLMQVIYGCRDPNPQVLGSGAARLRQANVRVTSLAELAGTDLAQEPGLLTQVAECEALIAPFSKWSRSGKPWVTVKTAWRPLAPFEKKAKNLPEKDGKTMIPPPGQKTFTSPDSLKLAHELRKRSDAILTGSGTVLSDFPEFTVRHVPDHPGKKRILTVLDRKAQVPAQWYQERSEQGFEIFAYPFETMKGTSAPSTADWEAFLRILGSKAVVELLVEAGPTLSGWILKEGHWDESVRIETQAGSEHGKSKSPDLIMKALRQKIKGKPAL